jgi:hypothetical protein
MLKHSEILGNKIFAWHQSVSPWIADHSHRGTCLTRSDPVIGTGDNALGLLTGCSMTYTISL